MRRPDSEPPEPPGRQPTARELAWLEENRRGFEAANRFVEEHGLWCDAHRERLWSGSPNEN